MFQINKKYYFCNLVYDSIAKIPSGILNGNVNQYGDFDQCMAVQGDGIKGRYCLAYMQIEVPESPYLSVLYNLIQSHSPFRSRLSDVSLLLLIK